MQPQDQACLEKMLEECMTLAEYLEKEDCEDHAVLKFKTNWYAVVYNAATRSRFDIIDEHYAPHQELYERFEGMLSNYMTKFTTDLTLSNEKLFHAVIFRWKNYKMVKMWAEKSFSYLQRYFVQHRQVESLEFVALNVFYQHLFQHVIVVVRSVLLTYIQAHRNGEDVNKEEVQLGVELFSKMNFDETSRLFEMDFVEPFVRITANYYRQLASQWVSTEASTSYLEKAEDCLAEEERRCNKLLLPSFKSIVLPVVEHELLSVHQQTLITKPDSGFVSLLQFTRTEEIKRMASLFSRIPQGLDPLAKLLREQCCAEGSGINTSIAAADSDVNFKLYVHDYIALHEKYAKILAQYLNKEPIFQKAVKDAFDKTINEGVVLTETTNGGGGGSGGTPTTTTTTTTTTSIKVTASELLANYCDTLLRGEKLSEEELDAEFVKVVNLFSYVYDKDAFQHFFKNQLSKRLLDRTSSVTGGNQEDFERLLISKLKEKFGNPFTSHFEGMLADKEKSSAMTGSFASYVDTNRLSLPMDFTVQVLTTGFWPKFENEAELRLPDDVQIATGVFATFYQKDKEHRILAWSHVNATATVQANFDKQYTLQMSGYQACALLLMNAHPQGMATNDFLTTLNLPFEDMKRILPSFVRTKLLIRKGDTRELQGSDVFSLNDKFTSQHRKMKIPLAVSKITSKQTLAVNAAVEEDRKHPIDACLVRIMKSRKQLEHRVLVSECIQQLSNIFRPDPRMIKLRVEDLLVREFLERVGDSSQYRYLA